MIKPGKKPVQLFYALLVEPHPGFEPTNWQQTPVHYRIIKHVGTKLFKGSVDAWKFLHNHDVMNNGTMKNGHPAIWAIYHDPRSPMAAPQ